MRKGATILLFLLSFSAFCQTPVHFESTKTQSYILNFEQSDNQSQRIVNDMMKIISRGMGKPMHQTKAHLSVEEHLWITRNGKQVNLNVAYEQVRLAGDLFYRSFDLADVLIPSNYSFVCALQRKNGTELKRFTLTNENFRHHNGENRFEYTDTIPNGEYQAVIISREFSFHHQAFEQFQSKCMLIDQYYDAEGEIASCYGIAEVMNTENFRHIQRLQQQLDELIARINHVEAAPFWNKLNIRSYDPIHIYPKLVDTKSKLMDQQKNLNYVHANLHRYYFDSGLQRLNGNQRNEARNDFNQSHSINPQYPQPIYYLALMNLQERDFASSMAQLNDFFALASADQELYSQATTLAEDVERAKITEVKKQMNQQLYAAALLNLDGLIQLCHKIKNRPCNDSLYILVADAHNAIYKTFLNDAQCDLSGGKFENAILNADKAIAYQAEHASAVNSNSLAVSLKQKINAEYYLALNKSGKSQLTAKEFKNAFDSFTKATEIEANYPVKNDKLLAENLRKSKLELLFLDIDAAQKMVQTNNLGRAREILIAIINDQAKYQLHANAKLSKSIEGLKTQIFSKQCMNAQAEYDSIIAEANESIKNGNYISALELFNKSKEVATKNQDCQLNLESTVKGIEYVQNPAKYQQDYTQIDQRANFDDFSVTTQRYVALTNFYNQNHISDYKIEHKGLAQFMAQYSANHMLWGANYLTNNQNFDGALYLLNQFKQKGGKASKTKSIQVGLAKSLALIDYKKNPQLNVPVKVMEYTNGDKWLKYFAKQYKKQIKSFQK